VQGVQILCWGGRGDNGTSGEIRDGKQHGFRTKAAAKTPRRGKDKKGKKWKAMGGKFVPVRIMRGLDRLLDEGRKGKAGEGLFE